MSLAVLTQVVGVTFCDGYPDNLHRLHELIEEHGRPDEGIAAVLIRDPDNPYDHNAVQVHVPAVGRIGSLPRSLAARVAPQMDGGCRFTAEVMGVRVLSGHEDRPGADVLVVEAEMTCPVCLGSGRCEGDDCEHSPHRGAHTCRTCAGWGVTS